jgi:hypothetical protein
LKGDVEAGIVDSEARVRDVDGFERKIEASIFSDKDAFADAPLRSEVDDGCAIHYYWLWRWKFVVCP